MPGSDRTSGLLTQLAFEFRKIPQQSKNKLQRTVYLGSNRTDLIVSDFWDKGWSCGYRNCQMLMSFLEKTNEMDESVIKHVISISGLQSLLERAWKEGLFLFPFPFLCYMRGTSPAPPTFCVKITQENFWTRKLGFDSVGALQLQRRVYKTRKWIGTTEVYTLLVYLGIKCTILDFDAPKAAGPATTGLLAERLFDCVQSYFEASVVVNRPSSSNSDDGNDNSVKSRENNVFTRMMVSSARAGKHVHMTDRPPMYLQHAGHSRTIVGIEIFDDGIRNLIVFDPGRRTQRGKSSPIQENKHGNESDQRPAAIASLQSYRVDTKAIERNSQYQLLVLGEASQRPSGAIQWPSTDSNHFLLTEWERDIMKQVTSIRVI
ncbi:peptidase family C78-domain-containing protein [Zychaea mexicana]|uniref:peptidase family C78-domain-containing protein n=1 Tax=Zychaea mexicana TaxID=64656 RepID=UPI0022FE5FD1|nr:peptidase family C78-domain-containing protein [Zychaea mexicana]KAI9488640.1 peptidase family C78-domain-containing protein [Zychaea mexicana]